MMSPAGVRRAEGEASGMLVGSLRELGGSGMTKRQHELARLKAWSQVHGLAMLLLDGLVPADEALIEHVISADFL